MGSTDIVSASERVDFLFMSTKQVGSTLRELFQVADLDGDGFLNQAEFVTILRSSSLGFGRSTIIRMIDAVNFAFEDRIDYAEFVPVMVELIEEIKERAHAPHKFEAEESAARLTAIDFLLDSVPQQDSSNYLSAVFRAADVDQDAVLTREEFLQSIVELDAGFTRGEITFIAAELEETGGGKLCYDMFVDSMFEMFIDLVAGALLEPSGRFVYWQNLLLRHFAGVDEAGDGQLDPVQATAVLSRVGFNHTQAQQLIEDASISTNGTLHYRRFARIAALKALALFGTEMPAELTASLPNLESISTDELVFYLRRQFLEADTDRNGVLSQAEFADLLRSMGIGLTRQVFRRVMEAADTHKDGWIEYSEFVPITLDIVQTRRIINEQRQIREREDDIARSQAAQYLMGGVPRAHLEGSMLSMFRKADKNSDGHLLAREFLDCLKQLELGLDRAEIAELMDCVDVRECGQVLYEDFVPLAFELVIEVLKEQFVDTGGALREMRGHFQEQFKKGCVEGDSKVSIEHARVVLNKSKLSVIQIEAILQELKFDEHRTALCRKLARVTAPIAFKLLGGQLPDFGSPARLKSPSKLALVSPIAREFADFRAVCIDEAPAGTLMLQSAREGNCAMLTEALNSESVDTEKLDANGYTALHWAAMEGFYGAAQIVLAAGANHNSRDANGWAAIHHATQHGHVQATIALIEAGADINCKTADTFQRTPIQLASWHGHAELVQKLLEQGACINDTDHTSYMNALHYAARYNRLDVVLVLLEMGGDVDAVASDGKTALHFAAKDGHIGVVHALVLAGADLDIVSTDQYRRTALHCASYNGNFNVVQYLTAAGARLEMLDADGRSVIDLGQSNPEIHVAITEGQSSSYQQRLALSPASIR